MSCARSRSRSGCSRDERLELGDHLRVPAELELGVDPPLERLQAELVEVHSRRGDGLAGKVGERRSAPQRERVAQERVGLARVGGARLVDELAETVEVELVRLDAQQVSRRPGHYPVAELAPQSHDVVLERRERGRRRSSPQTPSISRSAGTTRFACTRRSAATARRLGPPSASSRSPSRASSGPRIRNSTSPRPYSRRGQLLLRDARQARLAHGDAVLRAALRYYGRLRVDSAGADVTGSPRPSAAEGKTHVLAGKKALRRRGGDRRRGRGFALRCGHGPRHRLLRSAPQLHRLHPERAQPERRRVDRLRPDRVPAQLLRAHLRPPVGEQQRQRHLRRAARDVHAVRPRGDECRRSSRRSSPTSTHARAARTSSATATARPPTTGTAPSASTGSTSATTTSTPTS